MQTERRATREQSQCLVKKQYANLDHGAIGAAALIKASYELNV